VLQLLGQLPSCELQAQGAAKTGTVGPRTSVGAHHQTIHNQEQRQTDSVTGGCLRKPGNQIELTNIITNGYRIYLCNRCQKVMIPNILRNGFPVSVS